MRILRINQISLVFLLISVFACLASGEIWRYLEPGPYAVGYTVEQQRDFGRSFLPKHDFVGREIGEANVRPIQISIWYPAVRTDREPMEYADYVQWFGTEIDLAPMTPQRRETAIDQWLRNMQMYGGDKSAIRNMLSHRMNAVFDAPHADGSFPLIVYLPSFNSSPHENAIMFEYLASYGFVVASHPCAGTHTRAMNQDWEGAESEARDAEFVMNFMHGYPGVDDSRIGAMGFSWGGLAVSFLAVRNQRIDAVICMDGGTVFGYRGNRWKDYDYYRPDKVRIPFMQMGSSNYVKDDEWEFFREIKYGPTMLLVFRDLQHGNFNSATNLNRLHHIRQQLKQRGSQGIGRGTTDPVAMDDDGVRQTQSDSFSPSSRSVATSDRVVIGYETVIKYVFNYFNAWLKDDQESRRFLARTPGENSIPRNVVEIERSEALPIPPTEAEFVLFLQANGAQQTRDLYMSYRERDPDVKMFSEATLNRIGYNYLQAGKADEAVLLFEMNAMTYPDSANVYDSLGEACISAGDKTKAIENYRKSLELNPNNQNAHRKLQELGAGR